MTFHHSVIRQELRIRFDGKVTHEDIVDCCVAVAADPRCLQPDHAVIDFSGVEAWACPAPDVDLIAKATRRLLSSAGQGSRVSVLAPSRS